MSAFFLESPWRLGLTLAILCGCIFVAWKLTDEARWKRATLGALALSTALMLANIFVTTEREQLRGFLFGMLHSIEKQGLSGVLPSVSRSYDHEGVSYAFLQSQLQGHLKKWQFSGIQVLSWKYAKASAGGSAAEVVLSLSCKANVLFGGFPRPIGKTAWDLRLRREGKRWKIVRILPVEITLPTRMGQATRFKQLLRRRGW